MRRLLLQVCLATLVASGAAAEPVSRELRLMIGSPRSVVRELRDVALTSQVCDVVLEGIPAEADLQTLQVGGERQGVTLLDWRRLPPPAPAVKPGSKLRWEPGAAWPPNGSPREAGEVVCRLETANPKTRTLEVAYQIEGLSWEVDYAITIRGDITQHREPVSLDLLGRVVVSNRTRHAFPEARLVLVGERGWDTPVRDEPGMLMLDDWSPLADLWRPMPPAPAMSHDYRLDAPLSIPAGGSVSAPLVEARRQPAERIYQLEGADLSLDASGPWRPLNQLLVLRNVSGHGLGRALPQGRALVYLGGVRGGPFQEAWLAHTEPGGQLRISLGPAPGVTANRLANRRSPGTAGLPEQTVTLKVANALPTPVKVEVLERPPVPLAWDLVRSSLACERRGQTLRYEGEIEKRSELEITYTLRLMEPAP